MRTDMTCALYRFYDDFGRLLYVGITLNPSQRFEKHRQEKPWWAEVRNITLETLPDKKQALDAERRAIATERPLYNVSRPGLRAGDREHILPARVLVMTNEVIVDVRTKLLTPPTALAFRDALACHPGTTDVRVELPFDEADYAPHWLREAVNPAEVRYRPGGIFGTADERLRVDPTSDLEAALCRSFLVGVA